MGFFKKIKKQIKTNTKHLEKHTKQNLKHCEQHVVDVVKSGTNIGKHLEESVINVGKSCEKVGKFLYKHPKEIIETATVIAYKCSELGIIEGAICDLEILENGYIMKLSVTKYF